MMKIADPAENYENLAKSWALHLDTHFDVSGRPLELCLQLIEALWRDVWPETLEAIEADPHSFAARVQTYRYAYAMKNTGAQ